MYRTRKTQRENRKQAQWKREQDMVEGDSQYGSRERETLGEKTERERELEIPTERKRGCMKEAARAQKHSAPGHSQ